MMLVPTLLALLAQEPPAQVAQCRARPAQALVGERYRRGVPTRAKRMSGARTVRVIWPGQAATMDFREDRLNIELDRGRLITAVRCG